MIALIMYKQTIIIQYDRWGYGRKGLSIFVSLYILENKNPWRILTGNKNGERKILLVEE